MSISARAFGDIYEAPPSVGSRFSATTLTWQPREVAIIGNPTDHGEYPEFSSFLKIIDRSQL
jgi:hypothetical protein